MNQLTIDNRDSVEMIRYYEARIEAMAQRIKELESVIEALTSPAVASHYERSGV